MNRVIASVYAISIGGARALGQPGQQFTDEVNRKLVERIPSLIEEIQRLEAIAHDPLVEAALAFRDNLVRQVNGTAPR
jgi:hypothetical protein